jgi:hypothetical protein
MKLALITLVLTLTACADNGLRSYREYTEYRQVGWQCPKDYYLDASDLKCHKLISIDEYRKVVIPTQYEYHQDTEVPLLTHNRPIKRFKLKKGVTLQTPCDEVFKRANKCMVTK